MKYHEGCRPTDPPGYYFVTNNSFLNISDDEHHQQIGEKLGIPASAFITLRNVAKFCLSSTFVEIEYKQRVDDWHQHIQNLLQMLDEMEKKNDVD